MKKYIPLILAAILLLTGCSKAETAPKTKILEYGSSEEESKPEVSEEIPSEEPEDKTASEETLPFSEFKNLQFVFSSGAGGWATYLNIHEDGSFTGEYFDGEMGSTGEDYPRGTEYRCDFTGQFSQPVKVFDHIYSMKIEEINYEKAVGTEEVKDGIKYIYDTVYGLDGAEELQVYLPGTPLAKLPQDFIDWTNYYISSESDGTTLPFLGLYNEAGKYGFSSYDLVESVNSFVSGSEENSARIKESLENESLSQGEMNERVQQMYEDWDYTLNYVWNSLKKVLPEETMNQLLTEQREWIASKEQAVKEAGAEFEGGSLQFFAESYKAAELTQNRVYELMEYFTITVLP